MVTDVDRIGELILKKKYELAFKEIDLLLKETPKKLDFLKLKCVIIHNYLGEVFANKIIKKMDLPESEDLEDFIKWNTALSSKKKEEINSDLKNMKSLLLEGISLTEKILKKEISNDSIINLKEKFEGLLITHNQFFDAVNNLHQEKNITPQEIKTKLRCPYCSNDSVKVKVKKTEDEYTCKECNKTFLCYVGIVRGARGLGGNTSRNVTIRIEKIEGGETIINYRSHYSGMDFRNGDIIAVYYTKSWLASDYCSNPKILQNFTIGLYTDKI